MPPDRVRDAVHIAASGTIQPPGVWDSVACVDKRTPTYNGRRYWDAALKNGNRSCRLLGT